MLVLWVMKVGHVSLLYVPVTPCLAHVGHLSEGWPCPRPPRCCCSPWGAAAVRGLSPEQTARHSVPAWSAYKQADLWIRIGLMRIRIQHFFLIADPDPDTDTDPDPVSNPEFLWPKIKKKFTAVNFFIFYGSKIAIYLSLGLHKGRTSYRRSIQLSKENIQHFKTWKFFTFFYICGSFLPSWIRIQQLKLMRIRIHNPANRRNGPTLPWPKTRTSE